MHKYLLFLLICCWSCQSNHEQKKHNQHPVDTDIPHIVSLLTSTNFLDLDKIAALQDYRIVQTDESDPEGSNASWIAFSYCKNEQLSFCAESNWLNNLALDRVSFYDEHLSINKDLHPKALFKDIKAYIDTIHHKNFPDGTLEYYFKDDNRYVLSFDVSDIPDLYYGAASVHDIPDTLRVCQITYFPAIRH
ncbi:hypothetical protein ACE38W_13265 [Chitinophaga sp. Hz27]|uniref:hypothetical protein n=1 Tax=Chitinophaga sp. Hz27 TaxID=3347169 RepID=UPI0035D79B31